MVLAGVDRKTTVVRVCKWQCACETQPKNINYRHWQAGNHSSGPLSRHICIERLKALYLPKKILAENGRQRYFSIVSVYNYTQVWQNDRRS